MQPLTKSIAHCASRKLRVQEAEGVMPDQDARMMRRAKMRKVIKAQILELRLACGSCHGDLLPSTDEFAVYLNDVDGWLFLYEWDNATPEEMESRRD